LTYLLFSYLYISAIKLIVLINFRVHDISRQSMVRK